MEKELGNCKVVGKWLGELSEHCASIRDFISKATLDELVSTSAQLEQSATELEMYLSEEYNAANFDFDAVKKSISQTKGVVDKSKRALTKSITAGSKQAKVDMIKMGEDNVQATENGELETSEVPGLKRGRGIQ